MIEQLGIQPWLIDTVSVAKQKSVACVEAGHIYTDEMPSLSHEIGAIVGANVCTELEKMGIGVQRMLFVDDYNVASNDLNLTDYSNLLSQHGFTVDRTVMESTLIKDAKEVIVRLQMSSMTELSRNGAVVLKKNHKKEKEIVLKKSPGMGSVPACAALDAALYLIKAKEAGICVTVLHKEWKDQQEGVRRVLKALGENVSILEVYYSDDGEVEVVFDY